MNAFHCLQNLYAVIFLLLRRDFATILKSCKSEVACQPIRLVCVILQDMGNFKKYSAICDYDEEKINQMYKLSAASRVISTPYRLFTYLLAD